MSAGAVTQRLAASRAAAGGPQPQ